MKTREAFEIGKKIYEELGVDVENAIDTLSKISISMNCW